MIIDGDFFEFLYHLEQTCQCVNRDLREIYPPGHTHCDDAKTIILTFSDGRKKIVDVSECSDFRMIAIEVLKYINGA